MLYWIILGVVESLLASSLHPSVITTVHGGMWLSRKSPGLALDNHISGIFTRLKVEINLHHLTRRYPMESIPGVKSGFILMVTVSFPD